MQGTKVNILDSFQSLSIEVSKSLRKCELTAMLASMFEGNLFYIINQLFVDDLSSLSKLIVCRQDEFAVVPVSD